MATTERKGKSMMKEQQRICEGISLSIEPRPESKAFTPSPGRMTPLGAWEYVGESEEVLTGYQTKARNWFDPAAAMELLKLQKHHFALIFYPPDMTRSGEVGYRMFIYDGDTSVQPMSSTPEEAIVLAYYATIEEKTHGE